MRKLKCAQSDMQESTKAKPCFTCKLDVTGFICHFNGTVLCQVSIGLIWHYLEQGPTKQLVHSLVISHTDCCNSLLNGLSVVVIEKLQHVQNACARIILIWLKRDHIMLLELHWLPVKCRITFKTLLLVFKCLHDPAPPYLSALLSPYCPTRTLSSSDQLLLKQPTSRTKIGELSFSCASPRAWNQLPLT